MVVNPEKFLKVHFLLEFVSKIFQENQHIFKFTKKNNFSMIDIGTGPGTMLLEIESLIPKNYKEIVGTDKSTSMLKYFDTVSKDPRITSKILDITDEKMPDDLKQRFDFVFSSFCLQYVPDLRKTFRKCHDLLKPGGETFMLWSMQSHIYEVYRSLSQIDKWTPYTSDFKKWKSLVEQEDPINIIQNSIEAAGHKTVKIKEYKDFALEHTEDAVLELYEALDEILHRIPQNDQQKYKEDFRRIVRSEQAVFEGNEKFKVPVPTVVVITEKI